MFRTDCTYSYRKNKKAESYELKPSEYTHSTDYLRLRNYFYSYSAYYAWLKQEESPLASCQLSRNSSVSVSPKTISIKQPYLNRRFQLRKVEGIRGGFKRLMLPLILGGIIFPLSLIATYLGILNFWMGNAIFLTSAALFYQGWQGSYQMTVQFAHYEVNYFADSEQEKAVSQFIERINTYIQSHFPEKKAVSKS
jgi:hypothetical protein